MNGLTDRPGFEPAAEGEIDLGSLFSALWRRKGWVILWALIGLALACVFLFLVDPVYRSDARLLIERRDNVFTRPSNEQSVTNVQDFDVQTVASQVEVLQSRNLLKSVVDKLRLDQKAEFDPLVSGGSGNIISNILTLIGLNNGEASDTRDGRVLAALADKLSVYPLGESRVVAVQVTVQDPALSADIANAIAEEYLLIQREDSNKSAVGASQFLEKEIGGLRERVQTAERAVETFRAGADLLAGESESTLTKQQLSETLTLMSEVSSQRAQAEAKADQIRRLINSGAALDSSSDVQGSPLIQRLREQQVTLRARIVDLQTSLLPNHPQVQAARSQLDDLEKEIARQALLIARALEGDAEIATVRQQELEQEVARLKTATARANEQEVKLRALEREARAQRELLETYLVRFRESSARENTELLPVNARIISRANVPVKRHFPKTVPTLAVAGFSGAFLASLFILAGELMSDRRDRSDRPDRRDRPVQTGASRVPDTARREPDLETLAMSVGSREPDDDDAGVPVVAPLSERAGKARALRSVATPEYQDVSSFADVPVEAKTPAPATATGSIKVGAEAMPPVPAIVTPTISETAAGQGALPHDAPHDPAAAQLGVSMADVVADRHEGPVPMAGTGDPEQDVAPLMHPSAETMPQSQEAASQDRAAIMAARQHAEGSPQPRPVPYSPVPSNAVSSSPAPSSLVPKSAIPQQRPGERLAAAIRSAKASPDAQVPVPAAEGRDWKSRSGGTDLYSLNDAIAAVERYSLRQITVLPVFDDISCADLALEMARAIASSGKRVIFADLSGGVADADLTLTGFSDVVAGGADIREAIFADPLSPVDLMACGTLALNAEDWADGSANDIIEDLTEAYDVAVLHSGEGTSSVYLQSLAEQSDMLLFAVSAPLSRRRVADILRQKMGDVPAHSMFVYFEGDDGFVSAA